MKDFVMSKKLSLPAVVVQSQKVSALASQYTMCVAKTASSILELANVVYRAKEDLCKEEYQEFRRQINADKSKDSYLKKLHCIAQKFSRLDARKELLPAAYTTLYALSKLSDAEFQRVCDANAIQPNLTVSDLSKFKVKKISSPRSNTSCVSLTLKTTATNQLYVALLQIRDICNVNEIELTSNINFDSIVTTSNDDDYEHDFVDVVAKFVRKAA